MRKLLDKIWSSPIIIMVPVAIYMAGFLIAPHKNSDALLITIKGIGRVYTYNDVYALGVPMFFLSLALCYIIFKSKDEFKHLIYAYSILGTMLLPLTSSATILSTTLYWMSVVVLAIIIKKAK